MFHHAIGCLSVRRMTFFLMTLAAAVSFSAAVEAETVQPSFEIATIEDLPPPVRAMWRADGCAEYASAEQFARTKGLGMPVQEGTVIYGLPCDGGSAGVDYRLYWRLGYGVERIAVPRMEDRRPVADLSLIFNIEWDAGKRELTAYQSGGGGTAENFRWRWDGKWFALLEQYSTLARPNRETGEWDREITDREWPPGE